ncbi:MAG TPA: TRAP transporter substrate-binding protein [Candidatus Lustribacter sp.]
MKLLARVPAHRRPFLALAAAAMAVSSFAFAPPPARAAEPIVMKIGTATLNDMQHEFMRRYQAALNKDSKGRIKVEIYPASQLGSIPREIEATQFGSIQGWVGPPEFLAGVDPSFEALSAPSLLGDIQHATRVLNDKEFSTAFLALGANKGLKGLALFVHGPTAFDTRKPVKTYEDLKGMKIRVLAAQLQMEQVKRFGATAVPMALDQVLPALQQGAIDGVMSDLPVFTSLHYADSAKYVFEADQAMLCSIAVISKQWYDGLPPDLQSLVTSDGTKVARDLLPWITQYTSQQRKLWQSQGGVLTIPTPAEHTAIDALMTTVTADVLKDKPQVKKMVDLAAAAAARTK